MAKSHGWDGWGKKFLKRQESILYKKLDECLEQQKRTYKGLAAIDRDELKDPADLASAVLEQEANLDRANRCAEQIFGVARAILNIKNGTYGTCENCQKLIYRKRLEAVPWATKCIDCQKAEEPR